VKEGKVSECQVELGFALTLNLNEGYEGGHLRFPEYGAYLYRPGAGGAVVFSGSHLHERSLTWIEAGRRATHWTSVPSGDRVRKKRAIRSPRLDPGAETMPTRSARGVASRGTIVLSASWSAAASPRRGVGRARIRTGWASSPAAASGRR